MIALENIPETADLILLPAGQTPLMRRIENERYRRRTAALATGLSLEAAERAGAFPTLDQIDQGWLPFDDLRLPAGLSWEQEIELREWFVNAQRIEFELKIAGAA